MNGERKYDIHTHTHIYRSIHTQSCVCVCVCVCVYNIQSHEKEENLVNLGCMTTWKELEGIMLSEIGQTA